MEQYIFVNRGGHVEVFDNQNNFLFSADTKSEAISDLREMI